MVDNGDEQTTLDYAVSVCTYTRKDSSYFWLQWGSGGNRINRSSGVRLDDPEADLKQLQALEEERSMRWKCKDCRYIKHFTRPVPLEAAGRCPRCKSVSFQCLV
jgi:hypothetical protein